MLQAILSEITNKSKREALDRIRTWLMKRVLRRDRNNNFQEHMHNSETSKRMLS